MREAMPAELSRVANPDAHAAAGCRSILPGQQASGQGFDDQVIVFFAQAIQKHDDKGNGVGMRQTNTGTTESPGRLLNHFLRRRNVAFQKRQCRQSPLAIV